MTDVFTPISQWFDGYTKFPLSSIIPNDTKRVIMRKPPLNTTKYVTYPFKSKIQPFFEDDDEYALFCVNFVEEKNTVFFQIKQRIQYIVDEIKKKYKKDTYLQNIGQIVDVFEPRLSPLGYYKLLLSFFVENPQFFVDSIAYKTQKRLLTVFLNYIQNHH